MLEVLKEMKPYVYVITLLLWTRAIYGLSCDPCNPASCDEPICEGGVVREPSCGCCKVCAKQEYEECGGMFDMYGLCDNNLTCVIQSLNNGDFLTESKPGICKNSNQLTETDKCYEATYYGCDLVDGECQCGHQVTCSNPYRFQSQEACNNFVTGDTRQECADVRCNIQQSRSCPRDSLLIEGFTPQGECCPTPSRCECRADRCAYNVCPPHNRRVLVRPGSNRPGFCCDEYQCLPLGEEEDCRTVECAVPPVDSISCPRDSVATTNPLTSTACCPGQPMCQCRMDRCPYPPVCPAGTTAKISFRGNEQPSSCCDEYVCASGRIFVGCLVNGTRHLHGTLYEKQKCQICECAMGLSHCSPLPCPKLTCNDVTKSDEECCPRCVHPDGGSDAKPSCRSDDGSKIYGVGETWSTDDCSYCTCVEGGEKKCKAGFCQGPPTLPDAPSCTPLSQCSLKDEECPFGFSYSDTKCRNCRCRSAIWGCPSLSDCLITCPMGFVVDQSGCNTCQCRMKKCKELPDSCKRQCPYGYKQNKKNCERCKCRDCPTMNSCKKRCSLGLAQNKNGCTICKCKVESSDDFIPIPEPSHLCTDPVTGVRHDDGEVWTAGSCHMCICRGGDVMCDVIQCPAPSCKNPVLKQGECCPSCNDSFSSQKYRMVSCRNPNGDWWVEGEIWNSDQCTTCTCHSGHVFCTSTICPPIPCENPIYDQNLCCPKCLGGSANVGPNQSCRLENGSVIGSGSRFKTSSCTSCECQNGVVQCFNESCSIVPSTCLHPVIKKEQCCVRCLGESQSFHSCDTDEGIRMHAEEWNETSSACTTCMCVNGDVRCKKPACPTLPHKCRRLYRRPGECCEECVANDTSPVPPVYPSSSGTDQTVPIVLSVGFLFIFLLLIVGLALCIIRKRYPNKLRSLRFTMRFRHKYTAGAEENQMTIRSNSSDKIGERSDSFGGGSSGTGRSDMTNVTTSSEENPLTQ